MQRLHLTQFHVFKLKPKTGAPRGNPHDMGRTYKLYTLLPHTFKPGGLSLPSDIHYYVLKWHRRLFVVCVIVVFFFKQNSINNIKTLIYIEIHCMFMPPLS